MISTKYRFNMYKQSDHRNWWTGSEYDKLLASIKTNVPKRSVPNMAKIRNLQNFSIIQDMYSTSDSHVRLEKKKNFLNE